MLNIIYANHVNVGCNTAMDNITDANDVKHDYIPKSKIEQRIKELESFNCPYCNKHYALFGYFYKHIFKCYYTNRQPLK